MVSYFVTSGSAAITRSRAFTRTDVACLGSMDSPLGLVSWPAPAVPVLVAVFLASQDVFRIGADQPATSLGASSSSIMLGPPMSVFTTLRRVMLNPRPFRLVMNVPLMTRTGPVLVASVEQLGKHPVHQLRQLHLLPARSRLVVDAHADLDLPEWQTLAGIDNPSRDVDMLQTGADADDVGRRQPSHFCHLLQRPSLGRESTGNLEHEHGAGDSSPSNLARPLPPNANVVAHDHHLDGLAGRNGLFHSHAKVENVARVIHHHDQHPGLGVDPRHDPSPDLLGGRTGKDCAGHGSGEHARANHGREGGLMARASARDDGHLPGVIARPTIDDSVFRVEGDVGIGEGEAVEGGVDEASRVVDEVLCGHYGQVEKQLPITRRAGKFK
ncbi:hypothetical protein Trco_001267 [Trichoderma cornu-damae]|uniref:Uncharacterized protein n=1 Tax=Trichoderma cornu-damae TaxID=654480 RepID=A0A9P8QYY3_9HYPO|nr:hypothetical protein Trco_001267 [Trichoderma cornu-damae]